MIKIQSYNQEEAYNHLFYQTENELILNLQGKKAIIDHCIFGVDIDPEAVEVAKMALALKIVDNEEQEEYSAQIGLFGEQILNGVGNNIKCGNSLVDSTAYELYPDLLEDEKGLFSTKVFDWNTENSFQGIFESQQGFDFVIGNPPYVEIKHFKQELPYMHSYINDSYATGNNGKLDLAVPFIERGISILNDSGKLGYIIQKRFFKTEYGSSIRKYITEKNYISSITDFDCTSIFSKRLTYVAIVVLQKSGSETFHYHLVDEDKEGIAAYLRNLPIPEMDDSVHDHLHASDFGEDEWAFDCFEIRNRLRELYGTLGDYVRLKGGPQALKNAAYHIRVENIENGVITGQSQWANDVQVEVDACRPLFCNEQFYPFRPDSTNTYVIFPYDIIEGEKREIPFDEYCQRFPLAGAYLTSQRTAIHDAVQTMPERFPNKYDDNYWHLYTRPNNLEHTYPKVLIPMTALDTFANISTSEFLYADNANMWFVQIPDVDESKLYAIAGVINSTIFSVLARSIANPQDAGYFKFNKQFIEPVPFPTDAFLANENLRTQIANKAREIENRQNQFIVSGDARRVVLKTVINQLWLQLDSLVYELYDLAQEDITFFSGRGRNVDRVNFSTQWM
jgi:hypothetical protein